MSTTANTILAILSTEKFLGFRDQIRKNTKEWAVRALASYQKRIAEYAAKEKRSYGEKVPGCSVRHLCDGGWLPPSCSSNEYARTLAEASKTMVVNDDKVIKHADAEWADDKAFYAARVAEKINLFIGEAIDITLELSLNGVLEGNCTARLGEKLVVLRTSLKTNYRYGENSANGDITVYRQVPTVVDYALNFDPVAVEENAIKSSKQEIADRKAKAATIQAEIKALNKAKDAADAVYFGFRWTANGCQTSQAEGAPNAEQIKEASIKAKEAFQVLKGIREQIKVAKAALKAAKEVK